MQNFKFRTWTSFFLPPTWVPFLGDWGELLFKVFFLGWIFDIKDNWIFKKETLSGHDRQIDRRTWLNRFFSSRWSRIYILYRVSHVSFALLLTFCLNPYALFLFLRESLIILVVSLLSVTLGYSLCVYCRWYVRNVAFIHVCIQLLYAARVSFKMSNVWGRNYAAIIQSFVRQIAISEIIW